MHTLGLRALIYWHEGILHDWAPLASNSESSGTTLGESEDQSPESSSEPQATAASWPPPENEPEDPDRSRDRNDSRSRDAGAPTLDNLESLRGVNPEDVEKMVDEKFLQQGWTKAPLKRGDVVRYYDGKGNSFQMNKGYPWGGDGMHGGPYIKYTQGSETVRVSLQGNPGL